MSIETKTIDTWICDLCNNNRQTVPATETPAGWIEFMPTVRQQIKIASLQTNPLWQVTIAKPHHHVCPRCVAEIQRAAADVMPEVVS